MEVEGHSRHEQLRLLAVGWGHQCSVPWNCRSRSKVAFWGLNSEVTRRVREVKSHS